MSYTLLHLSDLHRSPDDPISNDELLSTLVVDLERYQREDPAVPRPDAVVVSGDLVQGVPLGTPNYADQLTEQYRAARDFLESVADELLDGNHALLVIVPGNHDVDWNTARAAMTALDAADVPSSLSPRTFGPRSELRWNWSEREVYRIINRVLYDERLGAYRAMSDQFYAGCDLLECSATTGDYALFELASGRIGVAAFNSCEGNDCFSLQGSIPEEAVARAHLDIVHSGKGFELLIAVWHHSFEGPPNSSDYMDVASVYQLISKGFSVGLHGHQHRAEVSQRYVHLPQEQPMAVISAGSLCAGARELPRGVNRQYNVIEFNDSLDRARVHVREMAIGTAFAATRRPELGGKTFVELKLVRARRAEAASISRERDVILEAERAISERRPTLAVQLLRELNRPPGSYQRTLYVTALTATGQWEALAAELEEPANADELGALVRAQGELGRFADATEALDRFARRVGVGAGARRDFESWLEARRALRE